jgi:hypothetical protein
LAAATLAGIPLDDFLRAEGDEELGLLTLVANKAIEFQEIQQRNLAMMIINYLGKALNSDKK